MLHFKHPSICLICQMLLFKRILFEESHLLARDNPSEMSKKIPLPLFHQSLSVWIAAEWKIETDRKRRALRRPSGYSEGLGQIGSVGSTTILTSHTFIQTGYHTVPTLTLCPRANTHTLTFRHPPTPTVSLIGFLTSPLCTSSSHSAVISPRQSDYLTPPHGMGMSQNDPESQLFPRE